MPKKTTKACCKVCRIVGEKADGFKSVSKNFIQCGRVYHEEEKLNFEGYDAKTMFRLCKACHEKYDLIGRWKSQPPFHIDFCYFCKDYSVLYDREFPGWTIDFRSRRWCHKTCLTKSLHMRGMY